MEDTVKVVEGEATTEVTAGVAATEDEVVDVTEVGMSEAIEPILVAATGMEANYATMVTSSVRQWHWKLWYG